jgi:lysozyme family protein
MSLQTALAFTLPAEGGFVDNPVDPGGATCQGVTQATYDRYRASINELNQSVRLIAPLEVQDIYREMYWVPACCDQLSNRLGVVHMDWSVNHGVSGAIVTLQGVVHVTQDGIFGPMTLQAIEARDENTVISNYLDARRAWYRAHVEAVPSQQIFLNGWLKRVDNLQAYVNGLSE